MSTTLITANEGIPSEGDHIVVSPAAIPFLLAAGWVRRDHALRDALATTPPPFVPVVEDVDFGEPNPVTVPKAFMDAFKPQTGDER